MSPVCCTTGMINMKLLLDRYNSIKCGLLYDKMSEMVTKPGGATTNTDKQTSKTTKCNLLLRHSSPRYKPTYHLSQHSSKLTKHFSCPMKATTKRFMYQCPKCHRCRNFLDDRDQFILYGVTSLWPTPPPAPTPACKQHSNTPDATNGTVLEGAYNICRVYHNRNSKICHKTVARKKTILVPNASRALINPVAYQSSQKDKLPLLASTYRRVNYNGNDLEQMVDILRHYVSINDGANPNTLKSSQSLQSSSIKAAAFKTDTSSKLRPTQTANKTVASGVSSLPKKVGTIPNHAERKQSKVSTSGNLSVPNDNKGQQFISPTKLEIWKRRLRCGACLEKNDWIVISADNINIVSGGSVVRKRARRRSRKRCSLGRARSKKKVDKSHSVLSSRSHTHLYKSFADDRFHSAFVSTIPPDADLSQISKRAHSWRIHPLTDTEHELVVDTNVVASIETVKIQEEPDDGACIRSIKRSRDEESSESTRNQKKTNAQDDGHENFVKKMIPVYSSLSVTSLLAEFKRRMRRCRGKGSIKSSQVEVTTYTQDKQSITLQALPKTYQQLGLAPLTRSLSSESSQFVELTGASGESSNLVKHTKKRKRKKSRMRKKKNSSCYKNDTQSMNVPQYGDANKSVVKEEHPSTTSVGKNRQDQQRKEKDGEKGRSAMDCAADNSVLVLNASPSPIMNITAVLMRATSECYNNGQPLKQNAPGPAETAAEPVTNSSLLVMQSCQ